MNPVQDGENPCDGALARCLCELPNGHDGPHRCVCGGKWMSGGKVVRFPDIAYEEDPSLADLLPP